jgi:quercetin dioxygenase-like cupin family protein
MWTGEDFGARENIIQPPPMGSGFRVVDFPAGGPGRMHRTDTVDYAIVLAGEIDMEMDDGLTVHLAAQDIVVQQGTNHSWINISNAPARIAFVLIDGKLPPGGSFTGPGTQELRPLAALEGSATPPLPPIRRVVTSHDADGKAMVMMDGPAPGRELRGRGNVSTLIWGTDETPADIWGSEDFGLRDNEIEPPPRGSWCRIIDYPPGTPGRMHRTDTVDYAVCMAGNMQMELDDGLTIPFNAGDVMVQQGTNHSWINNSGAPARIAFMLIEGKKELRR